ncbi:hypothetical protein [Chitinimonas prasina]|nr:hypothetical protein [Chitinimonas prasina]
MSVNLDPNNKYTQQYGGAFPVNSLPEGLKAVPQGSPGHYVIAPATPMSFENFQGLLNQVELGNAPATPMSFDNYQGLLNQVELGNFNVIR